MQVRLYNNRGYCLAKLGKYRAAVADYNKVLELDQTNCHAYHNRLAAVQHQHCLHAAAKGLWCCRALHHRLD